MTSFGNKVLITDPGGCRGALLAVRSLRKRNIKVSLLVPKNEINVSRFSRWKPECVYSPSPIDETQGFMDTLTKIVSSKRYSTIFPVTDLSLFLISKYRSRLIPYLNLVLPSHESILATLDKSKTLKLAKETGIPIPKEFTVKNISEVIDISKKIRYPTVIKPRQSYFWGKDDVTFFRPFYANCASELISIYEKVKQKDPFPLIQEYIPGNNISVGVLFEDGELKAACCISVKRTIPVMGGASVLRESIPPNPILIKYTKKLLGELCWHGIAEVEYRIDSRDSIPKLMEVNARMWGSMNVAIRSGIDFPYLLYLLATGKSIESVFKYKIGVKYRWLNADMKNFLSTIKGESCLANMNFSNKFSLFLDFLRFYDTNIHYDGFAISDPIPFFMDEVLSIYDVVKRNYSGS